MFRIGLPQFASILFGSVKIGYFIAYLCVTFLPQCSSIYWLIVLVVVLC